MAVKLGIAGQFNTGKSYSRVPYIYGENAFILMPTAKAPHITTSLSKPIQYLRVNNKTLTQHEREKKAPSRELLEIMGKQLKNSPDKIKLDGNYTIEKKLENLPAWLDFIDMHMTHIKTLFLPDFTHYISHVLASEDFIRRKSGGEAFQRYTDLAGLALRSFIESIDNLRPDLLVVTEYHTEWDEVDSKWKIFSPGGKMINEKFLLESYYDFMMMTHVEVPEDSNAEPSYHFITKRWRGYNARSANLFDTLIPNDIQLVSDKIREYTGMGPDHTPEQAEAYKKHLASTR